MTRCADDLALLASMTRFAHDNKICHFVIELAQRQSH
jgi:hypothetical protein